MLIRSALREDLVPLLELYTHLHGNKMPTSMEGPARLWHSVLADPGHHVLTGWLGDRLVSSCVVVVIPNLTHGQRPYALIENVITHPQYRGRGYATQLLNAARDLALEQNCYKLMLMTGSKSPATLDFYRRAGFNAEDKTAFVQWLNP